MSQPASGARRQPVYRRPSWAQNDASYKIHMRKDLSADRQPGSDYGMDNFSYDPAHVPKWQASVDLVTHLPQKLRDTLEDWEFSGAAVCTSLERIKKLDDESIHRAYPEKSPYSHLSCRGSNQSSAVGGAETPPMGSPTSPGPSLSPSLPGSLTTSFEGLPQRRVVGMESPPFTPTDSICRTPEIPNLEKEIPPAVMPDASVLTRQLSPMSTFSRSNSVGTFTHSGSAVFDENSWETYLSAFKAELEDIRQRVWSRFKGYSYTIDRLRIELGQEREYKETLDEFSRWWASMKPQVSEYEQKVCVLELPTLEYVRMERMAQGMPV